MLRFFYPFLLFRAFVCQHPVYILPSCWSLVLSENKNCWAQLPHSFPPRGVCSDPGNGRFFCSSYLNCFSLSGTKASQGTRSSLSEPKDFQRSYEYQISCRACMCYHGRKGFTYQRVEILIFNGVRKKEFLITSYSDNTVPANHLRCSLFERACVNALVPFCLSLVLISIARV